MKKIKSVEEAVSLFMENTLKRAQANDEGKFETGNKYSDKLMKCIVFLYEKDALEQLSPFLESANPALRLSAAFALLPIKTKECEKCLDSIANGNIKDHSFEAYYTLEEWKKGNLKFPYQEDWGK